MGRWCVGPASLDLEFRRHDGFSTMTSTGFTAHSRASFPSLRIKQAQSCPHAFHQQHPHGMILSEIGVQRRYGTIMDLRLYFAQIVDPQSIKR
jgi:hypothetical protein